MGKQEKRIEKIYSRNRIYLPNFRDDYKKNIGSKRSKTKVKTLINVIVIIAIALVTYSIITKAINPTINSLCIDEAKNIATKISNKQATIEMSKYEYEDIVTIIRDKDENIQMIQMNTKNINEITSNVPLKIVDELQKEENSNIRISIGALTGVKLFSAIGPKINVKIANVGNVDTKLESSFTAEGINQTLHRIYLQLNCEVTLLTPYSNVKQSITNQILIAESVIVGSVPNSYYSIQSSDAVEKSIKLMN